MLVQLDEVSGGRQLCCPRQLPGDGAISAGSVAAGTVLFFCGDKPVGSSNRGAEPYHEDVCIGWIANVKLVVVCLGEHDGPLL